MEKKLFLHYDTCNDLSWLFGLVLIHEIGFNELGSLWLQLKLIFVIILTSYHFYLGFLLKKFNLDQNLRSLNFTVI